MQKIAISQFANLTELARALAEREPFRSLASRVPTRVSPLHLILLAPAILADWILKHASHLADQPVLHLAVVSPATSGIEAVDNGYWYALLPELLGKPQLKVKLGLVTGHNLEPIGTGLTKLNLGYDSATLHEQPIHGYLEHLPDGKPDLLVMFDADVMLTGDAAWSTPLASVINGGVPTLAVAGGEDEQLLISGLLGLYGFENAATPYHSRFAVPANSPMSRMNNFTWGKSIWQVTAKNRGSGTEPGGKLQDEVRTAVEFIRNYSRVHESYPPLHQFGVVVEGDKSPAPDGRKLIQLPEHLYFDPVAEKLSSTRDGGLASLPQLDSYAAGSALLATYEGRDSRFSQILWSIRVFIECARLLLEHPAARDASPVEDDDDTDDEDEGDVCPGCGQVHSRQERIAGIEHILSDVLEGEDPDIQLQVALRVALQAAEKRSAARRQTRIDEQDEDDEPSDLQLYEHLLNRKHLNAAVGLWLDTPEVDDEGCDEQGQPLAILVIASAEFELFEKMLDAEFPFCCESDDGQTVFHALACLPDPVSLSLAPELLKRFEELYVSPNEPDEDGTFPLEMAAYGENWVAFEMLVAAGADVKATGLDMAAVLAGMREDGAEAIAGRLEALLERSSPKRPARKNRSASKQP